MPVPTWDALPTPPSRGNPDTFSDDADAFLGALPDFQTQGNAVAAYAEDQAEAAEASANAAAATVANAGYAATSTTSLAIGTGSKSLTVQAARAYKVGNFVVIADATNAANNMFGQVTAYDVATGALTVNVTLTSGSGTLASWTVGLSGPRGPEAVVPFASAAELRALTETAKAITPAVVAAAATYTALTDAATIAIDMSLGPNFVVTLGGNRTLGAPTNAKPGMTGLILVKQPSSGGPRTLAYNAAWLPFGATPQLSVGANAVDLISYVVETSSKIRFTLPGKGGAA